ncbi:E3 ubiquitin-protein ligase Zswim2 [Geranomyces variabilis]|nr:E3 ubiquitin-protein ligase Zswim2 [Geranomyces variabilis]
MSRCAPYRRCCPPALEPTIAKALDSRFFIVQELGPMAFVLKDQPAAATEAAPASTNITTTADSILADEQVATAAIAVSDKFKVTLGSLQSCTCPAFYRSGELCAHILWVMLKVFRVPRGSEMLYQKSLVEREIAELMEARRSKRAKVKKLTLKTDAADSTAATVGIQPRPLEDGDVCPICQEDLVRPSAPPALTYCKKSCGNHMHVKCVRVLMEHQSRSMGMENVKCPLCRKDLGSVESLKQQLDGDHNARSEAQRRRNLRPAVHKGRECQECKISPIVGKCHKCTVCPTLTLCDKCFTSGSHSEHTFTHRSHPGGPHHPSPRRVAPTLPAAMLASMETRELDAGDYEVLLTLDSPVVNQGDLPLHVVNSFPTERAGGGTGGGLRWVGHECRVCMKKVETGDTVRVIPCRHGFHRNCIDRWLLQTRTTCPQCGLPAYSALNADGATSNLSLDAEVDSATAIDLARRGYRANTYAQPPLPDDVQRKRKKRGLQKTKRNPEAGRDGQAGADSGSGGNGIRGTLHLGRLAPTRRRPSGNDETSPLATANASTGAFLSIAGNGCCDPHSRIDTTASSGSANAQTPRSTTSQYDLTPSAPSITRSAEYPIFPTRSLRKRPQGTSLHLQASPSAPALAAKAHHAFLTTIRRPPPPPPPPPHGQTSLWREHPTAAAATAAERETGTGGDGGSDRIFLPLIHVTGQRSLCTAALAEVQSGSSMDNANHSQPPPPQPTAAGHQPHVGKIHNRKHLPSQWPTPPTSADGVSLQGLVTTRAMYLNV